MPITKTNGGYKWGKSGKTYPTKAGAARQARAAYASGYKGYKYGGTVAGKFGGNPPWKGTKGIAGIAAQMPMGQRGGYKRPRPGGRNTTARGIEWARVAEDKQTSRDMAFIAEKIDPQTYIAQGMSEADAVAEAQRQQDKYGTPAEYRQWRYMKNFGRGSEVGTREELRAAGVNALPSLATSYGMPKNFVEEIAPYMQEHGTAVGAPAPRIPQEELEKFLSENPLGIRSLPQWWGG